MLLKRKITDTKGGTSSPVQANKARNGLLYRSGSVGEQDNRVRMSAAGEKSRIIEWIGKIRLIPQDKVPLLGCLWEGTFFDHVSVKRGVILSPDTAVAPFFKIGNRKK